MRTARFHSDDVTEIEAHLSDAHGSVRLSAGGGTPRVDIERATFGGATLARQRFDFALDYQAGPTADLVVCLVRSGRLPHHRGGVSRGGLGPGEARVLTRPDEDCEGRLERLEHQLLALSPTLLRAVAEPGTEASAAGVRVGSTPSSPQATVQLGRTADFLWDSIASGAMEHPLVAGSASRLLASVVPATFPPDSPSRERGSDRRDGTPRALGEAIAYMQDHAGEDISVLDVAASLHVSVRSLQYAFTRHRGTTPTAYLREVRLGRAHRELLQTDPHAGVTVSEIAHRWGFAHAGRFSAHYRTAYGRAPTESLRAG